MGHELLQREGSASRKILAETIPFTLLNKNGVVKPVNYVSLFDEVSKFIGTDIKELHIGTAIEIGLDFCVINSRYFAGELNDEDENYKNKMLEKNKKGKNELAEVVHRIIAKDPSDPILSDYKINKATIFGESLKFIDSNIQVNLKEITREIVNGIAIAKKACDIGNKLNRRELAGMFYVASRLLAMSMKFGNCHPFILEWNKDIQLVSDKNLKNLYDPKTIGAMYILETVPYLDQNNYPALNNFLSFNFGKEGEKEETLFEDAKYMSEIIESFLL